MLTKRALWLKRNNMHEKQWKFLIKAAELGRLPHALLFYGQEKLGKKKLAIDFAKHLVGDIGETNPDFILLEAEKKEIQIGQIRELVQKLSFKPYDSDYKVAIVDKAHLMTREAQNCFLKFLEEPTEKTILILITEYPATLLPTIISRVQRVRFYPSKDLKVEESEEILSDLDKLIKSDLAYRFQYAKKITEKDSNLKEILNTWLRYFRRELLSNPNNHASFIKEIQSTQLLLSTTNVNPKLALEILLTKL